MEQTAKFNVHWLGPYSLDDAKTRMMKKDGEGLIFYQIYGTHPVFGPNVLLYIGKTQQADGMRITQHKSWIEDEYDEVKIHIGSFGEFIDWNYWYDSDEEVYDFPSKILKEHILSIEKLLIVANQPLYNTKDRHTEQFEHKIAIYNTGRMGRILPESSSEYYSWTKEVAENTHNKTKSKLKKKQRGSNYQLNN